MGLGLRLTSYDGHGQCRIPFEFVGTMLNLSHRVKTILLFSHHEDFRFS